MEQRLGHLPTARRTTFAITQRSMERASLGATKRDKTKSEDLRAGTKVKDVIQKAVEANGHWAKHSPNE